MADESIEQKTARTRGPRPGDTATELEERNEQLIRDRLCGQSWAHIASKHGLTANRCMHIFSEWRKANPQAWKGRDPIDIVEQQLERLESWVELLADLADRAEDPVIVAAVRSQMDAQQRAAELMQATGILPNNLGTLRVELDAQQLAVRLLGALNAHGATVELKRAVIHELRAGSDEET